MLRGISWNNYIVVVVSLSIVWYLFIGLRYYFDDIKDLITGKRKLQFRSLLGKPILKTNYDFNSQNENEILNTPVQYETVDPVFNDVENLTASLKEAITDAIQKKLSKKHFKAHLQSILQTSPLLANSSFRPSLNELIISECEKQESFLLTLQEVDALWDLKN